MSLDFQKQGLSDYVEGAAELSPMILEKTRGLPHEYPLAAPLKLALNRQRLLDDFQACDQVYKANYLKERQGFLERPLEDIHRALNQMGFTSKTYRAVGMMQVGTQDLHKAVPQATAAFLQSLSPFCRAHYVISQPELRIPPHIDCQDYRLHGFRIHIPLLNSVRFRFFKAGREHDIQIEPGRAWFVNNAVLHQVQPVEPGPRISILLQLMSDTRLFELCE